MDRYYAEQVIVRNLKRIFIKAKKAEYHGSDEIVHAVTTRDLKSFLYIDDINQVGDRKEYVVRGRVLDIVAKKNYNVRNIVQPGYSTFSHVPESEGRIPYTVDNTTIIVDASSKLNSDIRELKVENILDVKPVDYPWDLNELLDLLPHDGDGLDFYEPERWNELNEVDPRVVSNEDYR